MSQAEFGDRTWIDERADRFESDWTRGGEASHRRLSRRRDRPLRGALLEELLRVERELRLGAGEQPGARGVSPSLSRRCRSCRRRLRSRNTPEAGPAGAALTAARASSSACWRCRTTSSIATRSVSAFGAWVADKSLSLGQILLQRGALSPGRHAAIEILVQEHLQQHGHDPERSLAVLKVVPDVRNQLEVMADLDLQASLLYLGLADTAEGDGDAGETRDGWDDSGVVDPAGASRSSGCTTEAAWARSTSRATSSSTAIVALKRIKQAPRPPTGRNAPGSWSRPRSPGGWSTRASSRSMAWGPIDDGRPFYAMRFIRGDNLKAAIEQFHADESAEPRPGPTHAGASETAAAVPRCLQRDRLRPQPGRAPPRPEAGQHHARASMARRWWSTGAWPRASAGRRRRRPGHAGRRTLVPQSAATARDRGGLPAGHAGVHEPRASRRQDRRAGSGQRRLQPGRHALLPADRPGRRSSTPMSWSCSPRSSGANSRRPASSSPGSTRRWRPSA